MDLDKKRIDDFFKENPPNEEDMAYIENLFLTKTNENKLKSLLENQWHVISNEPSAKKVPLDHVLTRVYSSIYDSERKNKLFYMVWMGYMKIAAMLLLPLCLGYFYYHFNQQNITPENLSKISIDAPLGSKLQFTLPDGSTGWLNSGSKISYVPKFGSTRDVDLVGEAWFDIKRDTCRPFTVKTSNVNIQVLGTKFNVNAFKDKDVDIVLESGLIVLDPGNGRGSLELRPKERVVIENSEREVNKTKVNTEIYSGWKDGKLVFRNDTIEEIAARVSRWYNVHIDVENYENKDIRLRATYEDESIDQVLYLLKLSLPIDYTIKKAKKNENGSYGKKSIIIKVL